MCPLIIGPICPTFAEDAHSSIVKNEAPNILVVGGGYWCRWSPEFALKHTNCDIVVTGEGDVPFSKLCDGFPSLSNVETFKGIAIKKGEDIIINEYGELVDGSNLDSLPRPEYELFNFNDKYVWQDESGNICCTLQTGRGCVGKCIFCTGASQVYRKYSHGRIIDEIRYLKSTYGITRIYFKEALTCTNNKWSRDFLRKIIDADLGITFQAICRVDNLDEEIVELLKEAGCFQVQLGIETADNNMLRNVMQKNITVQQSKRAVELCNKAGILPAGGFLLGMPGESIMSLIRTTLFVITTRISATGVTFPVPFPGTGLYEIAKSRYELTDESIQFNERMSGYDVFAGSYKKKLHYLEEFKFCDLSPHILILFHKVIATTIGINTRVLKKGRVVAFKELVMVFPVKVKAKIANIFGNLVGRQSNIGG